MSHTVTLPSKGMFYGGKLPDGVVTIRKVTVAEEEALQDPSLSTADRVNGYLRATTSLPPDFAYAMPGSGRTVGGTDALLSSDRTALILMQRIFTYGADFSFDWPCERCRDKNNSRVNLAAAAKVTTYEEAAQRCEDAGVPFGGEPYEAHLPDLNVDVGLRFLRGFDEGAVATRVREMRKVSQRSTAFIPTLTAQIISVSSIPDWEHQLPAMRESWVMRLSGADRVAISRALNLRGTGMSTEVALRCRNCGADNDVQLPMNMEFFLPSGM